MHSRSTSTSADEDPSDDRLIRFLEWCLEAEGWTAEQWRLMDEALDERNTAHLTVH